MKRFKLFSKKDRQNKASQTTLVLSATPPFSEDQISSKECNKEVLGTLKKFGKLKKFLPGGSGGADTYDVVFKKPEDRNEALITFQEKQVQMGDRRLHLQWHVTVRVLGPKPSVISAFLATYLKGSFSTELPSEEEKLHRDIKPMPQYPALATTFLVDDDEDLEGANAYIYVFPLNDDVQEQIKEDLQKLEEKSAEVPVILVGHLYDENDPDLAYDACTLTFDEAVEFSKEVKASCFMEVNARTGENVERTILNTMQAIFYGRKRDEYSYLKDYPLLGIMMRSPSSKRKEEDAQDDSTTEESEKKKKKHKHKGKENDSEKEDEDEDEREEQKVSEELEDIMKELKLKKFIPVLAKQDVTDVDAFMELTDENLKDLEMPTSGRNRVHGKIKELKEAKSNKA